MAVVKNAMMDIELTLSFYVKTTALLKIVTLVKMINPVQNAKMASF